MGESIMLAWLVITLATLATLVTLVPPVAAAPPPPGCLVPAGYLFVQGSDANGNDISKWPNATAAAAACGLEPTCLAFNSDGWLKASLANMGPVFYFPDPCQGTFLRIFYPKPPLPKPSPKPPSPRPSPPVPPPSPPVPPKPPVPPPSPPRPPSPGPCVKCKLAASAGGCRCNAKCECVYDWSTCGFDTARTGYNPYETKINVSTVGKLAKAWTYTLAGAPINQVLVLSELLIKGVSRNVAYIGDSSGTLHAVDADTGKPIWRRELGNFTSDSCFDLPNGLFGIGGTPTIDRPAGRLYVMSGLGKLFALNLTTGATISGWGRQWFDYTQEFTYGAITKHPTLPVVYWTSASRCDISPYTGEVVAVNTTTGNLIQRFKPSAPFEGGGVWGAGGVSIDPSTGFVLTATGNSDADQENAAYGEHVVSLKPQNLAINSSFTPGVILGDGDFGATPTPFKPVKTCKRGLVAVQHKKGIMYLLDAVTLKLIQQLQISHVTSSGQFIGTFAWDPVRELLVLSSPADSPDGRFKHGLLAFTVNNDCTLKLAWNTPLGVSSGPNDNFVFSSPTIAGGVVFMAQGFQDTLYALDVATGKVLRTVPLAQAAFMPPTVVNGRVYLGYGGWFGDAPVMRAYALP